MLKRILPLLFFILCLSMSLSFAQNETIDLEGYFQGKYLTDRINGLSWQPGTDNYAYIDDDFNIKLVNAKTGKETLYLSSDKLAEENVKKARSFQWVDANTLYFPRNHRLITVGKGGISSYTFSDVDMDDVIDQSIKHKLFIIKNDQGVFVESVQNGYKPILICPDTGKNITFGESVHRSEWGINEGQYISPNGNYIAFYRMDESMVEDYPLVNTGTPIATVEYIKYPMAGRNSHVVTLGIYDVAKSCVQGKAVYHYIQTDKADGEFLTNVTFSPDEKYIFITHLNRAQNHSKLIKYDLATGKKVKVLIEEQDSRYVEPLQGIFFLKNDRFLYTNDRDGWRHLYIYDMNGNLIKKVTEGRYDIVDFFGLDAKEEYVYFTAPLEKPVNQYVCKVNLKTGVLTRLGAADGVHYPIFSDSKNYFIDYFTNVTTPRVISLVNNQGKTMKVLKTSKNPYADCAMGETQIFPIVNKHGDSLWCRLITPPNMDKNKKYPVLIYVYGGPHSQLVTNSFISGGVFLEYMAQQGYIIFTLDNRGTSCRGAEFEKCIHRQLGKLEMEDQMCGVEYLKSLPYVDATRIGLDGWSFGGFMTLSLITEHPETFKAASCGGPVVNWEWYEVMYGERYMDTPEENPEGYAAANIISKIKNVKCPLLVMHGCQDHTVVWQHTLELMRQAVTDGIEIEYFPYTAYDHNVIGPERVHLWHKIERFHNQNLKGE
ncbi:MAG: DPP IV N-terminal domain-containing protein [Bacteroidales bacterium]|nr:DPP IV N-terminal domain-containing protein [Bacteroidales bacterium]